MALQYNPGKLIVKTYHIHSSIGCDGFFDQNEISSQESMIEISISQGEIHAFMSLAGLIGVPQVEWSSIKHNVDIIALYECFGQSLKDLLESCGGRFSLTTVLLLADQLITRLQYIHWRSWVHGDICPGAFSVGLGTARTQIYVSRLREAHYVGAATRQEQQHLQYRDLKYLGYMLIYFYRGRERNFVNENFKSNEIKSIDIRMLCEGLPSEFKTYMEYTTSAVDQPDYHYLRALFRFQYQFTEMKSGQPIGFEKFYDWNIPQQNMIKEFELCLKQLRLTNEKCTEAIQIFKDEQSSSCTDLIVQYSMLFNRFCDLIRYPADWQDDSQLPHCLDSSVFDYLELLGSQSIAQNLKQDFIHLAYQTMGILFENVPRHKHIWVKCLSRLAGYKMAIESGKARKVWGNVANCWFEYEKLPPGIF